MCIAQQGSGHELRFLVANDGPVDADSFNVGLFYRYAAADTVVVLGGIGGLRAGHSAWFTYDSALGSSSPLPAGYTAIADPRYTFQYLAHDRDGNSFMATGEVASRIPDANEQNNTLAVSPNGNRRLRATDAPGSDTRSGEPALALPPNWLNGSFPRVRSGSLAIDPIPDQSGRLHAKSKLACAFAGHRRVSCSVVLPAQAGRRDGRVAQAGGVLPDGRPAFQPRLGPGCPPGLRS
jgi:hypothetical protein